MTLRIVSLIANDFPSLFAKYFGITHVLCRIKHGETGVLYQKENGVFALDLYNGFIRVPEKQVGCRKAGNGLSGRSMSF